MYSCKKQTTKQKHKQQQQKLHTASTAPKKLYPRDIFINTIMNNVFPESISIALTIKCRYKSGRTSFFNHIYLHNLFSINRFFSKPIAIPRLKSALLFTLSWRESS